MKLKKEDLIKIIVERISVPKNNVGGSGAGIYITGYEVSAYALAKFLVEEGIVKVEDAEIETVPAENK